MEAVQFPNESTHCPYAIAVSDSAQRSDVDGRMEKGQLDSEGGSWGGRKASTVNMIGLLVRLILVHPDSHETRWEQRILL